MNYKNILITGGAGFIGSNFAVSLKKDFSNIRITVLDNLRRKGSQFNISRLEENDIKFIHGDIRNKEDLEQVGKFELLIECSAESSVQAGFDSSPLYAINTNLLGTINCLELARKYAADMIFLSTSRVYPIKTIKELNYKLDSKKINIAKKQNIKGITIKGISEEFPLDGARSIYGTTKLASELIMQEYIYMYNLKAVINRCSLIAGPWQMGKIDQGIVMYWIMNHILKKPLNYLSYNGKQVRDVLHIDDLYNLIRFQIRDIKKHNNEIYNVGGGVKNSFSLIELTEYCRKITGNKVEVADLSTALNSDIPYFVSDSSKIMSHTKWKPGKSMQDVIADTTKWAMEHKEMLKFL